MKKDFFRLLKKARINMAIALYSFIALSAGILLFPDNNDYHLSILAFITILWSIFFTFLKGKKHTIIAINASVLFWLFAIADVITYDVSGASLAAYSFFLMGLSFLFVLLYQEIGSRIVAVASIFTIAMSVSLYAIPVLYIIYYVNFGAYITPDIFYAIMQTNMHEAIEFIHDYVALKWLVIIMGSSLVLSYYLYKLEKQEQNKISISLSLFLIVAFVAASLEDKSNLRVVMMLTRTVSHYGKELASFKDVQVRRLSGEIKFDAIKKRSRETYIVVIGESLNKNHMSLYGYVRDTTPELLRKYKNNELLVFNNAYSSHTHTMPVLSQALTEANQLNNKNYYDSLSLLDILSKADIETFWVTNQVLMGPDDNLVGVIATQADHLHRVNNDFGGTSKTQKFDGEAIEIVKNIINQESDKTRVVFVHLMGNHGDYCSRYTEGYDRFKGNLDRGIFGSIASVEDMDGWINCYDNSVLYNDYVVSSLIDLLKNKQSSAGLLYISDHADDVFGRIGHNSGRFTFAMTQIPMLMWFSEKYKEYYSDIYEMLASHQETLFSNDFIYDTFLGIIDVNTSRYSSKYDLSNTDYTFKDADAYTLHGKKSYTDKNNYDYWMTYNVTALKGSGLLDRIIPHRVNSKGKLSQVIYSSYRSFELDVMFVDDVNGGHLEVGHDLNTGSNIRLDNFFRSLPINEIEKIWFDMKNINDNNIYKIKECLETLDREFGLKDRIIVESEITSVRFRMIADAGFHTSYYLPGFIAKLYRKKKLDELNEVVKTIAKQVKEQHCKAVSFDSESYPVVKEYLEKQLEVETVYHTWDLSMELKKPDFIEALEQSKYFRDAKVKTILVRYYSVFDL